MEARQASVQLRDSSVLGFSLGYAGHGSVESEDAEKGDSAEARGMPPKESCSVAGQSAVHATIDCETSVKSKIRDMDLPGGTMRAWDSPRG